MPSVSTYLTTTLPVNGFSSGTEGLLPSSGVKVPPPVGINLYSNTTIGFTLSLDNSITFSESPTSSYLSITSAFTVWLPKAKSDNTLSSIILLPFKSLYCIVIEPFVTGATFFV